jgi:hypothetical protein
VLKVFGVPSADASQIRTKQVPVPPPPGIAARRVDDDTVLVTYRLGPIDPRCRPVFLELTLDVNDDGESGAGTYARIRQRWGQISMKVPDHMRAADVFIASVRTREGHPSDASRVLTRR